MSRTDELVCWPFACPCQPHYSDCLQIFVMNLITRAGILIPFVEMGALTHLPEHQR